MAYSAEVMMRAKARLASLREDHASMNAARKAQVYQRVPRIRVIDKQMQLNMVQAAYSAFSDGAQEATQGKKDYMYILRLRKFFLIRK